MSTVKKALRGLSNLKMFPVTTNSGTAYAVGAGVAIEGVQEFSSTKEVEEWKIFADDGIFDSGSVWKGNNFTLTIAGLPLELRAALEGGTYVSADNVYTYTSESDAPEIAFSFASISGDGQKELTKIYCAKCTKVSFEHKTKGDNQSITPVKIEGIFTNRKADNAIFAKKDAASADIAWINTIDAITPIV